MSVRRKPDGTWYVRRMVDGKREFRSFGKGGVGRRAAQDFDLELTQLRIERKGGPAAPRTLSKAIDELRDVILFRVRENGHATYSGRLEWFRSHYGNRLLSDLGPGAVAEAQHALVGEGKAPKTINDYIGVLSRLMALAVRRGWMAKNHALDAERYALPDPWDTIRDIPDTDFKVVLGAIAKLWVRSAVLGLWFTGMRSSELRGLTWADVLPGRLVVRPTDARKVKSRSGTRAVPIPPVLEEGIESRRALGHAAPFGKTDGTPFGKTTLTNEWIRAVRPLGFAYRLHDLRHTYACRLAASGVNPVAAQRLLGHANIEETLRYYRVTDEDVLRQGRGIVFPDLALELALGKT